MKRTHPSHPPLPAPPRRCRLLVLVAASVAAILWATAGAAAPNADPARESVRDPLRVRAGGNGKNVVTLQVDGSKLEVTRREGDEVTTTVIDMDTMGRLVGDALGGAVAAMDDLQMQVRLGQDNRLDITTADGFVQVDLDQIMGQVAAAVRSGLEGIDTATWAAAGPRDEQALQRELEDLQAEMRALREELRRLRDSSPTGNGSR
ncbi:MAG: hypothetical protein IPK64_12970 [bacterium]|nr:hypothetical protein [bacterium]